MSSKEIHNLASWITVITGIIALWNFGFSVSQGIYGQIISVPEIPAVTMPFRLIFFILLETALAYAFGYLLVKLEGFGHGVPAIMIWVISLISSWTSLFNIQWLMSGALPADYMFLSMYSVWFFMMSFIAGFIALYFIAIHSGEHEKLTEAGGIQISAFIIMYFMYLFGS